MKDLKKEFEEKFGKDCPNFDNCGNEGTLSEHGCDGTVEDCTRTCPIPVQCEFCWTEPLSKFNIKNNGELWQWIETKLSEAEKIGASKAIDVTKKINCSEARTEAIKECIGVINKEKLNQFAKHLVAGETDPIEANKFSHADWVLGEIKSELQKLER